MASLGTLAFSAPCPVLISATAHLPTLKHTSTDLRYRTRIAPSRPRTVRMLFGSRYVERDPVSGLNVVSIPGHSLPRPPPLVLLVLCGVIVFRLMRRWLMLRFMSEKYDPAKLNARIASFYDARSAAWETVWGEHMHHGLYFGAKGRTERPMRGREAQVETMAEMLRMGGLDDPKVLEERAGGDAPKILDIGCGIGGASRYLASRFEKSEVTGITLSPVQAQRATELNAEAGLSGRVANIVCDVMDMDFPDNTFDVVWSLESAEHMADKHKLISECRRVLKPGGTLIMLAWCVRESSPPLALQERVSLRKIMKEYCLPRLAPRSEYTNVMRRFGMESVEDQDWTLRATPFWYEVAMSAFVNPKGLQMLKRYGWPLIRSALAMRHVMSAIRQGCFRLCAMTSRKPTAQEDEIRAQRAAVLAPCSSETV